MMGSQTCSGCGKENDRPEYRYCRACHAAYMRDWRKTNPLTPEHKQRDIARSYANVYKRRGNLAPQPCAACGGPNTEMHHIDHELPLEVTWLCRPCHLAWHAYWREQVRKVFGHWLRAAIQHEEAA